MRRVDYMLGGENFKEMTAAHFMQTDVYYYSNDSRGDRLATAITMGGFGSVPIVDKDKTLKGIVSEFDLLKAILNGKELDKITAEDIMTKEPVFVTEDTRSEEIINLLQNKHLIRAPVVDKEGKLIGVVARRDILQGYLKSKEAPPSWWF